MDFSALLLKRVLIIIFFGSLSASLLTIKDRIGFRELGLNYTLIYLLDV